MFGVGPCQAIYNSCSVTQCVFYNNAAAYPIEAGSQIQAGWSEPFVKIEAGGFYKREYCI